MNLKTMHVGQQHLSEPQPSSALFHRSRITKKAKSLLGIDEAIPGVMQGALLLWGLCIVEETKLDTCVVSFFAFIADMLTLQYWYL